MARYAVDIFIREIRDERNAEGYVYDVRQTRAFVQMTADRARAEYLFALAKAAVEDEMKQS